MFPVKRLTGLSVANRCIVALGDWAQVNREQLERIVAAIPEFRTRWDSFLREWEKEAEPPWYIGMSELAHYAVACQSQGTTSDFPAGANDKLEQHHYELVRFREDLLVDLSASEIADFASV
jgi:hypothetical protein